MTKMRKFVAALVLGLVMCLTLFTTGAFAHGFDFNHHRHSVHFVSVNAVAEAGHPGFFNGFGGFGDFGFFGHGFFDHDHAFARANVHVFDFDDHFDHFEGHCGNHCN